MAVALGPLLGAGKVAEVFAYGDKALKLYRLGAAKTSAFREAAILSVVEQSGLPAPRVEQVGQFDGRWGVVMTRIEGAAFAPSLVLSPPSKPHLDALAHLQLRIHQSPAPQLPALKARLAANIRRNLALDDASKDRLLRMLGGLPDGSQLCHGDFHPWNVMGTPASAAVVDWLDASCGDPAADVCRSYVLIAHASEGLARAYVDVYAELAGLEHAAIWQWLPVVAGARLAEGVPDEEASLKAMVRRGE
jgi:aminoglycoside phosphotransferase (APT) family kinase protein